MTPVLTSGRIRIKCSSTWFRTFLRSSTNVLPCILSNTLLMSQRSRYTVSSTDDIFLSIISFFANTCSAVDLFLSYTAWDMGIADSNLEFTFFIMQTANIFLRTDKIIIGRRFNVGLFGFPGFCSALKIRCVASFGCFRATAISLHISAILS